jgi:hypothetical protein
MGEISDALQVLQRIMEYKIASRDVLRSAIKGASEDDRSVLESFLSEQEETLRRLPHVFKRLKFDSPPEPDDDSVTEMMDGVFIEAAAEGADSKSGRIDFRVAALRVEEKAILLMKKPLVEHSLPEELRKVVEENLLSAEIHASQLRKMIGGK